MRRTRLPFPSLTRAAIVCASWCVFFAPASVRATPCTNPFSLQPMLSYGTGRLPVESAVADFNGDGAPDIAVTASNIYTGQPGYISILRGQPIAGGATGAFDPRTNVFVGGVPLGIVTDDLDGDGHADLVIGNWSDSSVVVMLGLGNGNFAAQQRWFAGNRPYEVVTGDFNADGVRDIAVADNGEYAARVLLGGVSNGHWDGTFSAPTRYALANLSLGIAAADLNGDGVTDLIATESYAGTIGVLIGNGAGGVGDGTFQSAVHYSAGSEPNDIAVGDFNGDGKLDLAVSTSGSQGFSVLLNTGSGAFASGVFYSSGANSGSIATSDIDGDGILDIVVALSVQGQLVLLRGNGTAGVGDGTFGSLTALGDCCFPLHVLTADLNGNGKPDAITCNLNSDVVGVFLDGCGANPVAPRITRIRDVPNDDGGKVFVTWTKSAYDVPGGAVTGYRVWRRMPWFEGQNRALPTDGGPIRTTRIARADGTADIVYWEALATLPAQRLPGYGYTAATSQDSLPSGNPYSAFFLTAFTSDIDVFYDSEVDSGYSVDNLPPKCPVPFSGTYASGATSMHWAWSNDPDFEHFNIYRGQTSNFAPSPASRVASPTDTGYVDAAGAPHWYKLSAVDRHGNESTFATLQPVGTTDAPATGGPVLFLAPPSPNPATDHMLFRMGWPSESRVTLALYDQQGRRMRGLLTGRRPAGEETIRWDRRDDAGHLVAPGVYFLRLDVQGVRLTRRIVLLH